MDIDAEHRHLAVRLTVWKIQRTAMLIADECPELDVSTHFDGAARTLEVDLLDKHEARPYPDSMGAPTLMRRLDVPARDDEPSAVEEKHTLLKQLLDELDRQHAEARKAQPAA